MELNQILSKFYTFDHGTCTEQLSSAVASQGVSSPWTREFPARKDSRSGKYGVAHKWPQRNVHVYACLNMRIST